MDPRASFPRMALVSHRRRVLCLWVFACRLRASLRMCAAASVCALRLLLTNIQRRAPCAKISLLDLPASTTAFGRPRDVVSAALRGAVRGVACVHEVLDRGRLHNAGVQVEDDLEVIQVRPCVRACVRARACVCVFAHARARVWVVRLFFFCFVLTTLSRWWRCHVLSWTAHRIGC